MMMMMLMMVDDVPCETHVSLLSAAYLFSPPCLGAAVVVSVLLLGVHPLALISLLSTLPAPGSSAQR